MVKLATTKRRQLAALNRIGTESKQKLSSAFRVAFLLLRWLFNLPRLGTRLGFPFCVESVRTPVSRKGPRLSSKRAILPTCHRDDGFLSGKCNLRNGLRLAPSLSGKERVMPERSLTRPRRKNVWQGGVPLPYSRGGPSRLYRGHGVRPLMIPR